MAKKSEEIKLGDISEMLSHIPRLEKFLGVMQRGALRQVVQITADMNANPPTISAVDEVSELDAKALALEQFKIKAAELFWRD